MPSRPWIVICSRQFLPDSLAGSSAYILSIVRYLRSSGYRAAFWGVSPSGNGVRTVVRLSPAVNIFDEYLLNGWVRIGNIAIRTDSPYPWIALVAKAFLRALLPRLGSLLPNKAAIKLRAFADRDWREPLASAGELAFAAKHLARVKPEAIFANYYFLTGILALPEAAAARKYVITHAVISERNRRLAEHGAFHDPIPLEVEIESLSKADSVIAIQDQDANFFRAHLPSEKVIVAPMAFPIRRALGPQVPGRCLFVGAWTQANSLGLQWFFDEVWPKISQGHPSAHLHVVGSICRYLSASLPKVVLRGHVEQISLEYGEAMVCVVPLIVGSGLKIKLVEAICHGRTGVTTSIGAEGVEKILPGIMAIADDPAAFAREVISLLDDDQRRTAMELKAIACGEKNFSPAACYYALSPLASAQTTNRS